MITTEGTRLTLTELAGCLDEITKTIPEILIDSVLADTIKYTIYLPSDNLKRRWEISGTHVVVEIIKRLRNFGYKTTTTPISSVLHLKYNPDVVITKKYLLTH